MRGTILGIPIVRTIIFWGLYWGSPYFGKVPCKGGVSSNWRQGLRGNARAWILEEICTHSIILRCI